MSVKEEYLKNGLVVLRGFFNTKDLDQIREEAKNIFSLQIKRNKIEFDPTNESDFEIALSKLFKKNYQAFLGAAKATQQMISLFRLASAEKIQGFLQSIGLVTPVVCVKPIVYFNSRHLAKIEGHYKTPAHQDWRSMQGSLNSVVIWIPLIDMSKDIGTVEFIPGSHLRGLLDSEADEWFRHIKSDRLDNQAFIVPEVNKGDAVIFSSFTVHRSGNNITDRIRWSLHVRYNDLLEDTFLERNFAHPYQVYKPDSEIVTPNFPTEEAMKKTFKL